MILSICENPKVLEITRLINIFVTAIRIVVPIVLIFSLTFKLVNAVSKSDEDGLSKVKKIVPKNLIAASIIFLIPSIVRLIVRVTASDVSYENCLRVVSVSEINSAYEKKMEELMLRAEESVDINNYDIAYRYVKNIKDSDSRKEYDKRLKEVKTKIDESNKTILSVDNNYANVNYSNFKWTYYHKLNGPNKQYYSNTSAYAIWAPDNASDLNGVSLPVIIWLHGLGSKVSDVGETGFLSRGLIPVVKNWSKYNLDNIPAIILAPQCSGNWTGNVNVQTIKGLVNYVKDAYNVDTSKIVLMGHSNGGYNVPKLLVSLKDLNFYGAVIMSAPDLRATSNIDYYTSIKIRGYAEISDGENFFSDLGIPNEFTYYPGTSHSGVIERAFIEDLDNDGVSDLIYWFFGKNESVVSTDDSNDNNNNSGNNGGGSSNQVAPTARPITDSVNIDDVNRRIANAAKSSGLYTRNAVVNVAKTTVSALESYNYYIPYQLGGMYHRGSAWGLNPNWGTVIEHNGKLVLSGLDCRNFVHWVFKQAGLSLIRGFGYEGSFKNDSDNRYANINQGRPGDVIDAPQHFMLIIKNNGSSYTVAESNGVGRVRIYDWTYDKLKTDGYYVYNMDAIYNNTGKYCPSTSGYRAYSGSCHIPKSEFPSYYGF